MLDVVVRVEGPLAPGADALAVTRVGPGGQAANVAAWAAALGAEARFVGKRGADDAGELAARGLAARGVAVLGPAEGRNGVVVSLVGGDGERTMASDRGVSPDLRPDELDPAWFRGCDWLHLTGYTLARPPLADAAAEAARLTDGRISVDLSWSAEPLREQVRALEPDLILANEREWDGSLTAPVLVLKRGRRGARVWTGREEFDLPALDAAIIDTTGAGDAFTAGFLVGGAELARETAARCVAQLGAMP